MTKKYLTLLLLGSFATSYGMEAPEPAVPDCAINRIGNGKIITIGKDANAWKLFFSAPQNATKSSGVCIKNANEEEILNVTLNQLILDYDLSEGFLYLKVFGKGKDKKEQVFVRALDVSTKKFVKNPSEVPEVNDKAKWHFWKEATQKNSEPLKVPIQQETTEAAEDTGQQQQNDQDSEEQQGGEQDTEDDKQDNQTTDSSTINDDQTEKDKEFNPSSFFSTYKPWLAVGGVGILVGVCIWYKMKQKEKPSDEESVQRNLDGSLPQSTQ